MIALLFINACVYLWVFLFSDLVIFINVKSGWSILWAYYRLNIIKLLTIERQLLTPVLARNLIPRLLINTVLGTSLKLIACVFYLFEISSSEYETALLKEKKKNSKICKIFFKKILQKLLKQEFAKEIFFEKNETFQLLKKKKTLRVILYNGL